MKRLLNRIKKLETKTGNSNRDYHVIYMNDGESEKEAISRYGQTIAENDTIYFIEFISPSSNLE